MPSNPSLNDWLSGDPKGVLERIAAEKTRRARDDFELWLKVVSPTWRWDWAHLVYMRAQLARLTRGEIRYLMTFCPPRHGKTEQNTVRYAAWRIERDPTCRVIIGAYNQGLAEKFSRKVRKIVEGRVPLDPAQQSVKDWATTSGGGVRAAGVGSGVTGAGANVILIDDPVKSRAEAESHAFRTRLWEWFTDDLYTRQEPDCVIQVTLTRWHEKDLAGQILGSEIAPDWTVVNLPALAEKDDPLGRQPGEALCPERYNVAELERRKRLMGRNFYALFQGSPRPAEGNTYKRNWFRYFERLDDNPDVIRLMGHDGRAKLVKLASCRIFATVDLATTEKTQADYTVFGQWAVTPDSDLILLDLFRAQMETPAVIDMFFKLRDRWNPAYFAVGANGIGGPMIQMARRGKPERDIAGVAIRAVPERTSKLERASTAIVATEAGQVYFPAKAPWLDALEAELLSFPTGAHDDQVDVVSLAGIDVFWRGGGEEIGDKPAEAKGPAEVKAEPEPSEWDRVFDPGHW